MSLRVISLALMFVGITVVTDCFAYSDTIYDIGAQLERSLAGLKRKETTVGDTPIAYLERERPGETIVLLHGFGTNKDSWIRFVRYLPSRYRVVVFDLPAHGDNPFDPGTTYTAANLAQILTPALLAVGGSRFHLVGHSLGGWVAILLTQANQGAIRTLSLFDTAGLMPPQKSDFQRAVEVGRNPLLVDKVEDFKRLLSFAFHQEPTILWPGKHVLAKQYVARADIHEKIWRDLTREPAEVSAQLRQLDVPVFILWGERDRIIDQSVIATYQGHLRTEVVVTMPGCGHTPAAERPRDTALYLAQFLIDPMSVANFDPSTIPLTALELPNR